MRRLRSAFKVVFQLLWIANALLVAFELTTGESKLVGDPSATGTALDSEVRH